MTIFEKIQSILYDLILPSGYPITDLAVDLVSLCATLFLIAIPFIIVFRIIKLLGGR